jgi:hypothetical protein
MDAPIGKIVTEIRAGLQADGGTWPVAVRGGRRFEGDANATGDTIPLVIVRINSRSRNRTADIRWRIVVASYDQDPRMVALLDARVSDILHNVGPRRVPAGVGVYHSIEDVGGQPGEDPDTGWSSMTSIYIVHGSAVTP